MRKEQFAEYIKSPKLHSQVVQWIADSFAGKEDNLCAVTLTFKPSIQYHETLRSKDIGHFLRRLNSRVYGKRFVNGKARLKCISVFENNSSDGVHVHMFLGRPNDTDRLDRPFEDIVLSEWSKLENAGINKAQKIRDCFNVEGWAGYITKEIKSGDKLSKLDVANMHIAV